ncbi:unnamed protein product [Strongylus vulgaris]|uniref:Uncharacterized protein n=1 Tax=Strongylus vulgaris TaxID=40348 RepID=A0A3P7IHS6_STRVU|nr:unnamed protein product [Strongylus vulgaris]
MIQQLTRFLTYFNYSRLPAISWKNDRVAQLKAWQNIPRINYATFSLGNHTKKDLESFFDETVQFFFNDISEAPVSNKAPVLHWTPLPLDSEIQVLIRISFLLAGPDDSTFVEIRKSLRGKFNFSYEWTAGILLMDDPVGAL